MGYIIPVQPIQAQVYANRMLVDEYNFAYISNVHGIKMKSLFEEKLRQLGQENESKEQDVKLLSEPKGPPNTPHYKNFIQPNPINLSTKIAEISGKGNNINLYV